MTRKQIRNVLRQVRERVSREIADFAKGGLYAAGLASEGYAGGYRRCLDDMELLLNGVVPSGSSNNHWWEGISDVEQPKERGRKRLLDTPEDIERVCQLSLLRDWSINCIAHEFEVSPGVVRRVLIENQPAWASAHEEELSDKRFRRHNPTYNGERPEQW